MIDLLILMEAIASCEIEGIETNIEEVLEQLALEGGYQ